MQQKSQESIDRHHYEPAPGPVSHEPWPYQPGVHLCTGPGREPSDGPLPRSDAGFVRTDRGVETCLPGGHVSRSKRVLVADDDGLHQRVAAAMLGGAGFLVHVVANGALAVEALSRRPYDVILMDCEMPELDGYGATREIRRLPGFRRHTPIVAVTSRTGEDERQRCLAAGMDDFLTKPVCQEDLVGAVVRWNQLGWVRRRNAALHWP